METDLQELLSALNLDLVDPELDLEYLRSGRKQYHEYRAADIDRLETQASLASAARTFRGAFPTEQIEKGLTRLPKTIASTGALHKLGYMFGPRTSIKDMIAFFMLEFRDSIVVCRALGKSEVDEIVGLSAHMELQQGRAATSSSNGSVHRDRTVAVLHLEDFENANTGFINWWRDLSHASSDAADFRRRGMAEGAFERDFLAELCLDDFRSAMSVISNTTFHTAMKGRDTEGTEATSKGLQK